MAPVGIRVLLVEDNPLHAHLLQGFLKELGHPPFPVRWVTSLEEGLKAAGEEDFEVVLLDLVLPDSQGLETFLRWKSAAPQLPVVVLTGLDDMELATRAVENGAQDYLIKNQINRALLSRSLRYTAERTGAGGREWDCPVLRAAHQQFLQAAEHVKLNPDTRERLLFPRRSHVFSLPFRSENGSGLENIFAYRVSHIASQGPILANCGLQANLALGELAARAMNMSWQSALFGVPFAGVQGGIRVDPRGVTESEKEQLVELYRAELSELSTSTRDIFFDRKTEESIEEAAGAGLGILIEAGASQLDLDLQGATAVILGVGPRAQATARFLKDKGVRIVGMGEAPHKEELLQKPCDIMVIQEKNFRLTSRDFNLIRCRLLAEGVNDSITPEDDQSLEQRGIMVLPDILGGGGSIMEAHRQWKEGATKGGRTDQKLGERLISVFERVQKRSQEEGLTLRQGALCEALDALQRRDGGSFF